MAASTRTRRFELLQVIDPHPKDIALQVIPLTSSMNIEKE
jgi:hypothetical protein